MKLVQFTASWCGPCRAAIKLIQENYDADELGHTLVDIDKIENAEDMYKSLYLEVKPKSIPTFVVIDGSSILDVVRGYDPAFISAYAEQVKKRKDKDGEEE